MAKKKVKVEALSKLSLFDKKDKRGGTRNRTLYQPGEILEVDEASAKNLIELKLAKKVKSTPTKEEVKHECYWSNEHS